MDQVIFKAQAYSKLMELKEIIDSLEVQPPQADMVQPLVGPPDAGQLSQEPAALARRQTLSEVKSLIKAELESIAEMVDREWHGIDFDEARERILQQLDRLSGTEPQDAA